MKRDKNIVPLSRDHHFGLLCSWKIRQGLKKDIEIERIKNYIEYFWNTSLKQHFNEEELLFSDLNDELTLKVIEDHSEIENTYNLIVYQANADLLKMFSDLLENHIRFEERQWFPYLESIYTTNELEKIGIKLNEIHHQEIDNYQDEFWK